MDAAADDGPRRLGLRALHGLIVGRDGAPKGVTMPAEITERLTSLLRPGSPLPPMLVSEAGQRIGAAADAGHEGALKLESFFVGQAVGSFSRLRPAAEITRQIVGDCEERLAELAALLPAGTPAAP